MVELRYGLGGDGDKWRNATWQHLADCRGVISNGAPLPGATVHLRAYGFDAVRLADDQGA